jgi:putative hydrolase of the HAD superfamily
MDLANIKNIIFDLGGVILNIDMLRTEEALAELGVSNLRGHMENDSVLKVFQRYETGHLDDDSFLAALQSLSEKPVTAEAAAQAWNALLLDFPEARIELLKRLKKRYRVFLLSNTNAIHFRQFQKQLFDQAGHYLEELFEKTYYSHTLGLRKPDVAVFQHVVNENRLDASATLFVDDTEINMPGAVEAGLQVLHLKKGMDIVDIDWKL